MSDQATRDRTQSWIVLAWTAWGLVVGLSLAIFAHKIPAYFYRHLDRGERAEESLQALGLFISPAAGAWWITLRDILVAVVSLAIALALVRLAPRSRRMLFFSATLVATGVSLPNVLRTVSAAPEWEPVSLLVRYFAYNLFIVALFIFPQGRIKPRWIWPFIASWPLVTGVTLLGRLVVPEQATTLEGFLQALSVPWLLAGLFAQIQRYRNHSNALERQQTRWVITGFAGVFGGGLLLSQAYAYTDSLFDPATREMLHNLVAISLLGFPPAVFLPLAIGFSIARYRLWDLGDLLHSSLLYGLTTALCIGLWIGVFSALEALALSVIGPTSDLAIIFSTLAIAALVRPLHRRLQRLIDRSLYRQQVDFDEALVGLATELRSQIELRRIADLLLERIHALLYVRRVELYLEDGTGTVSPYRVLGEDAHRLDPRELTRHRPRWVEGRALDPAGGTASLLVPLLATSTDGPALVGVLALGPRRSGEGYSHRTRRALERLAREAGTALHVAILIHRQREERERLISELEARTAELEQFLDAASHELKSSLFTIQGHLGILRQARREHVAGIERPIDRIAQAAETLGQHLEAILRLAQVGRGERPDQEVPLEALILEAVEKVDRPRGASPVEIQHDLSVVRGSRQDLLQVFISLIDNASKFSQGAGRATRIRIGGEMEEGWVRCFVRDDGRGIDPAYHERVFRLFEQLDPSIPGLGVGLSLARRIVEMHGGRIWVESSQMEAGCTVWLTLPAASQLPPGSR